MQNWQDLGSEITEWIKSYAEKNKIKTLVVGVSGGIDSAVVSTLCAKTGLDTIVLNMPIHQSNNQLNLSNKHIDWLISNWENVEGHLIDLTETYDLFCESDLKNHQLSDLVLANTRARGRMATLYAIAGSNNGIVVGTGNKVEDFGVGFYTKYGDGGVDISPIADLYKSEVYALADSLGVLVEIQEAAPTDGLWDDGRTDEGQLGFNYSELEDAMGNPNSPHREQYEKIRNQNLHKMEPIPVCKIPS